MSALQVTTIVVSYLFLVVGVSLLARAVSRFVRVFTMGAADPRRTNDPMQRTVTLVREFLLHTRMARLPLVAAAHWVTMISFGLLFLTLVTAFGQVWNASFALPLIGHFPPFEWLTELFAWGGLVGILYLISVRLRNLPRNAADHGRRSRFFGSTFWQAYYVEYTILGVVLCIITLRGLEYALYSAQGSPNASLLHFPLTAWLGSLFAGASVGTLSAWIYVIATLKIVISFAWMITISLTLTMGVAWHRFLAFFNIWFKRNADGRTALGPLKPMYVGGKAIDAESLEEVMDSDHAEVKMGVGAVEDFTWKGLLDFTTCTECGRCQSQCPAWNTDKPLSPKLLMMTLRNHAHEKAPWVLASENDRAKLPEPVGALAQMPLVGSTGYELDSPLGAYNPHGPDAVIDEDVLWSCTTCGACVEQCPVDIEHVDTIVDMRRHQVLIESAFPAELGGLFKNMEGKQNPWGMAPKLRLDWAKGLPFDVPVVGSDLESLDEVDYLFWVGCAGAYEDRAKKTTRAVAELLNTAGVSFAVLGEGEACTGDSARRAGNEILFQMLAAQNIETLNEVGAKKIVVTCAHCFNTLKNEYPQTGGNYEVVHHTQLLNRLVREKKLVPVARPDEANSKDVASTAATVTYHDPCYLGRHNHVYAPPRELIGSLPGVELREMPRHGEKSFCCGAGGARMWMEEKLGTRINLNRTAEAVATGADRIAVGCPFCRVMLSDGLTAEQSDGSARAEVEVVDVAQMLLAAVRRGEEVDEVAVDEVAVESAPAPDAAPVAETASAAPKSGGVSASDALAAMQAKSGDAPAQEPAAASGGAMSASDALAAMQAKSGDAPAAPADAPSSGKMSASDALAAMQAKSGDSPAPESAPASGKMSASDALAAMQAKAGDSPAEAPASGKMSASDALAAMQAQSGAAPAKAAEPAAPAAPTTGKMSASDALAAMQAQNAAAPAEAAESAAPATPAAPAAPVTGKMSASDALAAMMAQGAAAPAEPAAPAPAQQTAAEPAAPAAEPAAPAAPAAPVTGKMSASDALAAMMAQSQQAPAEPPAAAAPAPAAEPAPTPEPPAATSESTPSAAAPAAPAAKAAPAPSLSGKMSASDALAAMMAQSQQAPSEPPADAAPAPATEPAPAADSTPPAATPEPAAAASEQPQATTEPATNATAPAPPAPAAKAAPTPALSGKMSASDALAAMMAQAGANAAPAATPPASAETAAPTQPPATVAEPAQSDATPAPHGEASASTHPADSAEPTTAATATEDANEAQTPQPPATDEAASQTGTDASASAAEPSTTEPSATEASAVTDEAAEDEASEVEQHEAPVQGAAPQEPSPAPASPSAPLTGRMSASEALKRMRGEA